MLLIKEKRYFKKYHKYRNWSTWKYIKIVIKNRKIILKPLKQYRNILFFVL